MTLMPAASAMAASVKWVAWCGGWVAVRATTPMTSGRAASPEMDGSCRAAAHRPRRVPVSARRRSWVLAARRNQVKYDLPSRHAGGAGDGAEGDGDTGDRRACRRAARPKAV
jgi:hypothetical protein